MKTSTNNPALSNNLLRKGAFILYIFAAAVFFFSSCKKDFPPNKGKNEIIVHSGSSIQEAVNLAVNGSVIIIEPGIYKEAIVVNTKNITIKGLGDNKRGVTIQNPGDEENGITVKENGDGFVLKNVTVRDFEENGVFLIHVDGFLLSHVTTIDNGEYGLFPVLSKHGVIEHCIATGHSDTGIYVGQSSDVDMNYNEAYANVNGLEIENCSNVTANFNHSYNNTAGILVILLPGLQVKKSSNITISKNEVSDNNHENFADGGFEAVVPVGSGILIVGTDHTTIENNDIRDNNFVGIGVASTVVLGSLAGLPPEAFADIEPNPDNVKVINNVVMKNGSAPPANISFPGVDLLWDGNGKNNCWSNNVHKTTYPESLPACD